MNNIKYINKQNLFKYIRNYFIILNIANIFLIFVTFNNDINNYKEIVEEYKNNILINEKEKNLAKAYLLSPNKIKCEVLLNKIYSSYLLVLEISLKIFFIIIIMYIFINKNFLVFLRNFFIIFNVIHICFTFLTYIAEVNNYEYMLEEYNNNRVTKPEEIFLIKKYLKSKKEIKHRIIIDKFIRVYYLLIFLLFRIFIIITVIYILIFFCRILLKKT